MINLLSRRHFLRTLTASACAAACPPLIAADRTASSTKVTKTQSKYQDSPNNGQQCSNCPQFVRASNSCKIVQGVISPEGWCNLFVRRG